MQPLCCCSAYLERIQATSNDALQALKALVPLTTTGGGISGCGGTMVEGWDGAIHAANNHTSTAKVIVIVNNTAATD